MGCDDSDNRSQPHLQHPQSEPLQHPQSESLQLPSSSSSSSESSFREIEDAFLQTQTRIWLGEVLQIRLDEQLAISEVLADGELLFQVSKVVWRLLLAKHMELRHIIAYQNQQFAPKKNSGRYRPYSNVDSFLKICKILGLTGIDLFSPSDVVEKRNTRKVCMCIRSFSKKARSKKINVPDFDVVTYTITMPKDMVGCIRRNLELSQSSLSDSPSYYLQKHAGGKFRQDSSVKASARDHKTYLEGSDDTEINHPELQSHRLCTDFLCRYTSQMESNVEDTQVPSMVKSVLMSRDLGQLDIQSQERIETSENEFDFLCSMESLHSSLKDAEHDCQFSWSSSPSCGNSHNDFNAMVSPLHPRVKHAQEGGFVDLDYSKQSLFGNNSSVIGIPMTDRTPARSHSKDSSDPEENSTPNVHQSASSYGSNSTPGSIENSVRYFEISDDMVALNLGDKFDAQDKFQKVGSLEMSDGKMDMWKQIIEGHESQASLKYREMVYDITSNARYSHSSEKHKENEHFLYSKAGIHQSEQLMSFESYLLSEFCKWDQKGKLAEISANNPTSFSLSSPKVGSHEETTPCKKDKASKVMFSVPHDEGKTVENLDINDEHDIVSPCEYNKDASHIQSCLRNECSELECKDGHHEACQYDTDPACHSEDATVLHVLEETKPEDEVLPSVETKETSTERPRGKPQNAMLLKSVLGGTAAFGMLFMFLHLRKNGKEKDPASSKASDNSVKDKVQKISSENTQKRSRREGVYPAEKLKLGD